MSERKRNIGYYILRLNILNINVITLLSLSVLKILYLKPKSGEQNKTLTGSYRVSYGYEG